MKYFKVLILPVLLIAALLISCERDDICPDATPTTPRLLIDLLDVDNPDIKKNVFDIVVIGVNADGPLEEPLEDYIFQDVDDLVLPLNTTESSTEYIIIKEASVNNNGTPDDTSDDFLNGNQDRIIITYDRETIFVSRACGFKIIFTNINLEIVDDGDNWMLSRIPLIDNQSIEDETTTHFTISH